MKKLSILAISMTLALTGCASSLEEKMEAQREMAEINAKKQDKALDDAIDTVPSWFLDVPEPDETGVYGVGAGESNKLHYSLKIAELQAKFDLAKQFKEIVSGQERSYESQDNQGNVTNESNAIIDSLVEEIKITGFKRVKREIAKVDGKVISYVLLKMPFEQYNSMLLQAQKSSNSGGMEQAYELMRKRIEERKGAIN